MKKLKAEEKKKESVKRKEAAEVGACGSEGVPVIEGVVCDMARDGEHFEARHNVPSFMLCLSLSHAGARNE